MSDKFGKFGKFKKPGEFADEAKEVVTEETKVEETPTTFGKVRVDETAEVKEEIKKDTRHFAKRQLTWFKREENAIWIDKDVYTGEALLDKMCEYIDFTNI